MPGLRNSNFSATGSVRVITSSKKPEFKLDNPNWSITAKPIIKHHSKHSKTVKSKGGTKKMRKTKRRKNKNKTRKKKK